MFLHDNRDDTDFSVFMSIWSYEEQKHALVLMEYLHRFRPDLVSNEAELYAARFEFVGMIPKNLSTLFGQTFESAKQLNRFRKSVAPT